MNFVDYGGYAAFLHTHDTFPRFSVVVFTGGEEKDEQTSGMFREAVISHSLSAFCAPEIIVADKDMGFIGKVPREFRTSHNIALRAVIPGHLQSSGGH